MRFFILANLADGLLLPIQAFVCGGLIAVVLHKLIIKHSKKKNGQSNIDPQALALLLAVLTIPLSILIWAIFRAIFGSSTVYG